jgi:predicted Zn-dependent peptidase
MKYSRKTLKNGLNVFVLNIADAQSVVFTIFVKAGSRYEKADEAGVAHFLEHVFFKGSKKYPQATDISTLIDGIGGDFNAATSKEWTEFYIRAEKHNFEMIFEILTDMIQNPLFAQKEIDREKGVVIEEINLYQDNPGAQVENNLEKIMWPKSKLGKEIIGTRESIRAMSRKQIFGFKQTYYQPKNMILGISGAVSEKKVWQLLRDSWAPLKNRAVPKFERVKEKQSQPNLQLEFKDTKQAHLALGFKSFGHGHKDNPAALLLASILGGSMSSRLFVVIREEKGLAYFVRASNSPYYDSGNFTIHAGLQIEKTMDALRAILDEVQKIKSELVSEAELKRARDFMRGKVALGLEDNQEKLNWVLEQFAFTEKIKSPEELFTQFDKVTAADLQRVAKDIFSEQNMSLAVIGPFKNIKAFKKALRLERRKSKR